MAQLGLPADIKAAARLRLYKSLLCQEVLSKIQAAAMEACNSLGIGNDQAELTLKELFDATVRE